MTSATSATSATRAPRGIGHGPWWATLVRAMALTILGLALAACDDDTPPITTTSDTGQTQQDTGSPWPDLNQDDQYVWPDTGQQDGTVWPDTYSAPFGCKQDSDCFGQRCCATPWGVKLCAPICR